MLASTSNTPGKSPVRKLRTLGSVRGAPSYGRPYRDHAPQVKCCIFHQGLTR